MVLLQMISGSRNSIIYLFSFVENRIPAWPITDKIVGGGHHAGLRLSGAAVDTRPPRDSVSSRPLTENQSHHAATRRLRNTVGRKRRTVAARPRARAACRRQPSTGG